TVDMLPTASIWGSRPAACIRSIAYLRPAMSASEYATLLTPSAKVPPAGLPYRLRPSRLCCSRVALMRIEEELCANSRSFMPEARVAAAKPRSNSRRVSGMVRIIEEHEATKRTVRVSADAGWFCAGDVCADEWRKCIRYKV